MTSPFIAEAERAAAEALAATDELDILDRGECTDAAIVAVAAVVPILAEHFAQAVEAAHRTAPDCCAFDTAARVIREAATPTEGGTT
jgi:hypothetical protein